MKKQGLIAVATAVVALAACDGFKEAMTAHVDTVARAGSQELSVTRLSDLLATSKAPLEKQVAKAVADIWVDYHLLAQAAVDGDTLNDAKLLESAMWSATADAKAKKWYEQVSKRFPAADAGGAAATRYAQSEVLAARHILLGAPREGLSTGARAEVRKKADALRARVTPANFAKMATDNSQDPGSAKEGGALGVFPRGVMVPEFEKAILAIKPGEISPVIETDFGYHIIYRQPFAEVSQQVAAAGDSRATQVAESTYFAKLEAAGNIQVKADAPKTVKAVVADLDAHKDDNAVLATSVAGDFRVRDLVRYVYAFPTEAQMPSRLGQAPDSLLPMFVKSLVGKELFLRQADSAKVVLDSAESNQMRRAYTSMVVSTWNGLALNPSGLADSAKSESDQSRLAASRVENYLDRLFREQTPFVPVPRPLEDALRSKYEYKLNDKGLQLAVDRAKKIRATMDSTRAASQPRSSVPMPAGAPPQQMPQQMPQQTPPAPRP